MDSTRPFVGLYENNGVMIRAFKGDFRTPTYVAWNEEFEVAAVSDGELQSVMLYDASGKQLNRFSYVPMTPIGNGVSPGIVSAPLCYPAGICWVDANRLLIADRSEHRVFALDIRNFCIEDVLTDSVDGLRYPVAVATNRRNRIVLTEEFYDFGVNEVRLKMFRLMSSETY